MIIFKAKILQKIMGHKNEELILLGKNDYLLKDKIVYARSCCDGVERNVSGSKWMFYRV